MQKEADEKAMLSDILRHYDFNVDSVQKVRSAFKICTDKGNFCLKRVSNGYRKVKKSFYLIQYLKERGFDNIADFYYTKDDKAWIKRKDAAFYLTYWIEGREVSFKSIDELLRCSELLACFHNQAKGFEAPKKVKIKNHSAKWLKTFKKQRDELVKYKSYIDKLKLKGEFDFLYKSHLDYFASEADYAMRILELSGYKELCDYYKNEGYICHDSFYYQNILFDEQERMYIVDLESCRFDLPVSDLGKFIRRVLSKKRFLWDFDLCRKIIESYCRIRPLTREEYGILLAMLVFPHKAWKLGKKRYIKNKKWNEEKYREKLNRLLREREFKKEFIYCYIGFYGLEPEY